MKLQIDNLKILPDGDLSFKAIEKEVKRNYQCPEAELVAIVKKSLDARKKDRIHYTFRIIITLPAEKGKSLLKKKEVSLYSEPAPVPRISCKKPGHIVVVGTGPAGLFAALRLTEAGLKVTLLERGKAVEERVSDIKKLETTGTLNPESNVVFGEGGAGTYSDGKLTARTRRQESTWFYEQMVAHGASPSILYEAKPHIGTDALVEIIRNLRHAIESRGGTFCFSEKATTLIISGGEVKGLRSEQDNEYLADAVILATGHSARDTYAMVRNHNVALESKGFALGVRIEHPADLIREIQYGASAYRDILPPAEYAVSWNNKNSGRGIYSFCMCPGGRVINSSSEHDHHCVNGMSLSDRGGTFSNAALVVSISKEELSEDIFSGIALQRAVESAASAAGGGKGRAPAQRITSFLDERIDSQLPETSYLPGVAAGDIRSFLPGHIADELAAALPRLDNKMKGFITEEALLIGAETRTSSPVRISRGKDFTSLSHKNLYPAGEGAGYAGGIVSSAVDGIRAADAIIESILSP